MSDKKGKHEKDKNITPPLLEHALSDDKNVWDMTNRYGTYDTQNTTGTENDFPQIAQGLSHKKRRNRRGK